MIYEKTDIAKNFLPESEWWRIVNFDLSDKNNIVDWTHEREWRVPNDFTFERNEAVLLFVNSSIYHQFIKLCDKNNKNYLSEVKSVAVMDNLLY